MYWHYSDGMRVTAFPSIAQTAGVDEWQVLYRPDAADEATRETITTMNTAQIRIEPDAGDEGPPCLSLTCPCGEMTHQCDAYNTQAGPSQALPGVKCEACGRFWRLDIDARGIEAEYETFDSPTVDPRDEEFDRWLAAHDAEVAAKATRDVLAGLVTVVRDKGRAPSYHDRVAARVRGEWPSLIREVSKLVKVYDAATRNGADQ